MFPVFWSSWLKFVCCFCNTHDSLLHSCFFVCACCLLWCCHFCTATYILYICLLLRSQRQHFFSSSSSSCTPLWYKHCVFVYTYHKCTTRPFYQMPTRKKAKKILWHYIRNAIALTAHWVCMWPSFFHFILYFVFAADKTYL